MNLDKETEQKVQELQVLEHNLQNLLVQKQAFNLELNETVNALEELKKTDDTVYKIVGQVMLKTDKEKVQKELEEKKKLLELRAQAIEKQEKLIEKKAEEIRDETKKDLDKKSKK